MAGGALGHRERRQLRLLGDGWKVPAALGLGALSKECGSCLVSGAGNLFPEVLKCFVSYTVRFSIKSGKSVHSYGSCFLLRALLEWEKSRQRRMNQLLRVITRNLLVPVIFLWHKTRAVNPEEHRKSA